MPSSGNVVHNDKERRGVSGRERKAEVGSRGRRAIGTLIRLCSWLSDLRSALTSQQ